MFDPFDILKLEKSYSLDLNKLEKHYFAEQRKAHPDQFSQASDEEKNTALKKSTMVNQAYLTLKNPLQRAAYLLKDVGIEALSHDPTFLGQVMIWNERLENGEDLKPELYEEEKTLVKELEIAFGVKDYEKARAALYQLNYVQKLLN